MPTRKQRRRQQKSRRHEYEYVYVDDEGKEVAVDPAELRADKDGHKANGRPRRTEDRNRRPPARASGGRRIEPPSWRRSFRRALILGPVLVAAMMLLNRNVSLAQQIAPAVVMVAFFVPFSYFTDGIAYRMYRRRAEGRQAPRKR
jgi:hypothetical protein